MPLADPSLERVSACPVHFLWDGRGRGRAFVRAGFLGFLAAALLVCAKAISHVGVVGDVALVIAGTSFVVWALGQAISFVVVRRISARHR